MSNGTIIGKATQATSEGKCGPVETGLTGPAATALKYQELSLTVPASTCQQCLVQKNVKSYYLQTAENDFLNE